MINKALKLASIALVAFALVAQAGWKVGDTLPDFKSYKLEGSLPDGLKGKVVLVDFWASWCGPCKASFPVLNDLQKDYGAKGLVIVGVNQDKTAALMNAFLKDHPAAFTVLRDAQNLLVAAADISSMPTSYLIDRTGKIRFLHSGFRGEKSASEYKKEIETLLNEKQGGSK